MELTRSFRSLTLITIVDDDIMGLEKTILSVMSQSYWGKFEYLIKSSERCRDIAKVVARYEDHNLVHISMPDNGIYEALNQAVKLASGEVIGFLHAGDTFVTQNALHSIVAQFNKADLDLCYSNVTFAKKGETRIVRKWRAGHFFANSLDWGWMPPHPSVYASKHLFSGDHPFDPLYKISADYKWLLSILLTSIKVNYYDEYTICMEQGGASSRNLSARLSAFSEDYRILNELGFRHPLLTGIAKRLRKACQFTQTYFARIK